MTDELTKILTMMQEMTAAIKTLVENQERLQAEQARAGAALGEAGALLKNHADVLRYSQAAIETLWRNAGLPIDPSPPENTPPLN